MRSSGRIIASCLLTMAVAIQTFAGNQIYRYKDSTGTLTFTTEFHSIPEKYRGEAVPLLQEAAAPV